ncbi:MAG: transglutaminase domain-containing protein [Methanobrevibacter sp.]|uniref:transglutaminase domain-containing protein n=1 Tax=Methanobrevibacter sp. TaxID=66852 RepID=UPI002E75AF90|nr:Ig-like domain repeat protein [Methanobrevibacter sp.]MEE0935481.1 transglutaminase domain-containing protein [Methanobrevibacter sp.]
MNNKLLFSLFFIIVLSFSLGAIHASDVNVTDNSIMNANEMANLQIDDEVQLVGAGSQDMVADGADYPLTEDIKNQTDLSSKTNEVYYKGHYSLTLTDANSNMGLANKTVTFTVNDVNYTNVTDDNGVVSFNLNLNTGKYQTTAFFSGDSAYESFSSTSEVNVLPTIKASDITKYYKGSKKYIAAFHDSYGNPLKNTLVRITVNGKTYSKKTNGAGYVSLDVNLKPGTYKVTAADPVTGYTLTTTFKILSTITANDVKNVYGDSKKFTAKFFKSNGKALANKYVKIKLKGKIYKVKTNSKGQAKLALNKIKKGTYKVISYNTDGLTKTNTVKICPTATTKLSTQYYELIPGDNKVIQAKFTTGLGDDSKAGKAIKITINGKTYSKKTDSNGIVSLNVKSFSKGLYTVEYKYVGNKFFKASKTTNIVTIIDNVSDIKLTAKNTRLGYGAYTPINVALTAGGVPLPKRTVTFSIEGSTYAATIDNKGIASVLVNLDLGNYTINYSSNSKFNISGTSGSCMITVFERSADAKLTWKSGTSYKDTSQSFKVLLTDPNGKPLSGQTVELTIDGEIYYGKTASNGYATIKTNVAFGKYKVSVTALGDNNYLPTSTSKTVNVKLSKFGSGLNAKNTISKLSAYHKSSRYCPVNNAKIKALVKSLTEGLTNEIDKAKALFNYVRDSIWYDYYYNSHKGAVGTLKAGYANCVDQAHLLIAMYRTAGFNARYVHGTCKFSDGWYGHVWTQVLIGNTWVVGDPIGYDNSLGKIKNWNNNNYRLHNRYVSLPF